MEPLSQWIKLNENIDGVKIKGPEEKIALFADGVLIYLTLDYLTRSGHIDIEYQIRYGQVEFSPLYEFGLKSGGG